MKNNKWLLILLVTVMLMQTYTVNAKSKVERDKLKFEDIEGLLIRRNPTIRINRNTRKNLIDSKDAIRDTRRDKRDLKDAIAEIDKAIGGLNQIIKQQDILMGELMGSLIPITGDKDRNESQDFRYQDPIVYDALIQTIGYVQGLYKSNISTLEQNTDALKQQLKQFDKLPAQELELDKIILQLEIGDKGIVLGAQNMYLAYNSLKRQRDELMENLELLDNQMQIMILQQELGIITLLDIENMDNQREQLESTIGVLENQMDNIKREINLMLDINMDSPLYLEDNLIVDEKALLKMDYEDDLKLARRNSYSLWLKDYDYRIKDINFRWSKKYGNRDEIRAAERELENAAIELEQGYEDVELNFHKAYMEVKDKIEALEIENKNFEYQQKIYEILELKYDLGIVSEMELKQGKAEYNKSRKKVETEKQNLFQSWLQYETLIKGISF